jgi:glycosyltransferase involved in cell wall biosynthesis
VFQHVPAGVPVVVSDDPAAWDALAMLRRRNPMIGVLHADEPHYYALASRFQHAATAIVSVSRRVFANARGTGAGSEATTDVIPCGIPLPTLATPVRATSERLRLVWVGRINEYQKRVSDLAAIAAALRGAGRAFRLDIIGDGEDAARLRALLQRSDIADDVQFLGWLPASAVQSALSESDLMLLPSNFEGMPVAAMEALACGCAVIGSDTCGLEEYQGRMSARNALWIYPRGNVGAAVAAIETAARVERDERRRAARRLAEEEFAIAVCMRRYEDLLSRLPRAEHVATAIPTRHIGDIASWVVSRARLLRRRANGLVAHKRHARRNAAVAVG